jgi:hypothetical protein
VTATDALTADLKGQVKLLADDLRNRVEDDPVRLADWKRIHTEAVAKDRTAMTWVDWREDRIDQAAVAWVLTTVFIRFCEDNSLVKPVWISGLKGRRQEAFDAQLAYFREHPEHSDREWLLSAIRYLQNLPATRSLVDAHSALAYVSPSGNAVSALLDFWRHRDDDGALTHDLHDESLSTRFLGDLYQDLSDYAKDKYALLQTPVFVEEHILDRTLEPALNDRPLDGFRMIDPTCGSGHFLLGAFARLLDRWHKHAPDLELRSRVQSALDAIHGVDLNPFAVAIARFRLTVAALDACRERSLENAPAFKFHLATGDSLIHGPDENVIPGLEDRAAFMPFHYSTEDSQRLLEILAEGRYDAVVGNPPYITPKDKALNKIYRSKFGKICKGSYALTVPFIAQFFALARQGEQSGWVGLITSNSFMKREFGAPLIEEFFPKKDLRLVLDTSVAYIPGHGTPTVILVGRNSRPISHTIRAVLGRRGEPTQPEDPANGIVWVSIVEHVDQVGWDDDWITVVELDRNLLALHPWSLGGGGAVELLNHLDRSKDRVGDKVSLIGRTCHTGTDDAYLAEMGTWSRFSVEREHIIPLVGGEAIRDWAVDPEIESLFPYDRSLKANIEDAAIAGILWTVRSVLSARREPGGTHEEVGLTWYEYSRWHPERYSIPLGVTFPSVATHNHFALDRGGKVFKQSAPVIKFSKDVAEDRYLELLGILNSSTACFWLKQKSYAKTGADNNSGGGNRWSPEPWYSFYDFSVSTVERFPLPRSFPLGRVRILDELAGAFSADEPHAIYAVGVPSKGQAHNSYERSERTRHQMVALQEELDWEVYRLFGLIEDDLTYDAADLPGLKLGQRAFEIALAKTGEPTAWFERHGSIPITEIPEDWPAAYQELIRRRLDLIANHPYIKLLEKPEYKRRWTQEPWEKRQEKALQNWLLDRLEDRRFWFDSQGRPSPRSVAQAADDVTRDPDIVSVLALWEGRPDVPVSDSLTRLLADKGVPFHAGYRYKDSGLRKRAVWEETWALQRREDAGEKVEIEVPPKYASADFAKAAYWKHRGKLDVPKERFILYPDAARDGDGTQLLGWAGWDHAEQALALATIINEREDEGWPDERLVPLIAGLAELQPWVDQWHRNVHPDYGVSLAAFCAEELATRAAQVSMTEDQLRRWRPEKKTRKGRGTQ